MKGWKTAVAAVHTRAGWWAVAMLATLALLATMLSGGQIGRAIAASDGSAWLWSRSAGQVAQVSPYRGRVEQRREVPGARGHQVQVTQDDRFLLIHDLDTGRVSSLDLNGLGFSGRLDVGMSGDPHLAMGSGKAAVVERTSGEVRALDPATLRPVGTVLRLPGPLVGGEFDGAGLLWVGVPQQGTAVAVKFTAQGPAVARTAEVAEPGRDLVMSVLDRGALVVDRSGRDLVVVTSDAARRVTAPVPLGGAMVPERTHGVLAAVTVPAAGSVVTLGDLRKSGSVQSFPLSDPVQEPAVPFAGKVYVPMRATGQVRVFEPTGRQTGVLSIPSGREDLEVRVREGSLFVNVPGSADALVVGTDGVAHRVGKYTDGSGRNRAHPTAPTPETSTPPPYAHPVIQNPPPVRSPGDRRRPRATTPETSSPTGRTESSAPSGAPAPTTAPRTTAPRTTAPRTTAPRTTAPRTTAPRTTTPRPRTRTPKKPPAPRTNPYTPQQVCNASAGGNYRIQRSSSLNGARIYQLYSASTKKNCAVTMKTANIGTGTNAWVRLQSQKGGKVASDSGTFKYYAGPVFVYAPGDCVRYSGGASGASTSVGWANCG